jgi:hypothetical protein
MPGCTLAAELHRRSPHDLRVIAMIRRDRARISFLSSPLASVPMSMRATNSIPSRSAKPLMRRAACASATWSLSEIPRAEFSMPRTRLRPMFAQSGPFGL